MDHARLQNDRSGSTRSTTAVRSQNPTSFLLAMFSAQSMNTTKIGFRKNMCSFEALLEGRRTAERRLIDCGSSSCDFASTAVPPRPHVLLFLVAPARRLWRGSYEAPRVHHASRRRVGWPLASRAQNSTLPVIGFMSSRSPEDSVAVVAAFRSGLSKGGLAEGKNVLIEFRWARGG